MSRLNAPWTEKQVDAINAFQKRDDVHPFTCAEHSESDLVASQTHLYCRVPGCLYQQNWCHDWMAGTKR